MKLPREAGRAPKVARYVVSLPERVVRSAAALAGGLIREIGDVSVPSAVRRTKTYQMMVDIALRFMIEQVGEVKGVYPSGDELASDFLAAPHGGAWHRVGRSAGVSRFAGLDHGGAGRRLGRRASHRSGDRRCAEAGRPARGRRQIRKRRSAFGRTGADRQPGGRSVQCAAARCGRPAPRVGRVSRSRGQNSSAQSAFGGIPGATLGGVESRSSGAEPARCSSCRR